MKTNKMKNGNISITAVLILAAAVLGCSFYNPLQSGSNNAPANNSQTSNSNDKTIAEKAVDSTVGEEKSAFPNAMNCSTQSPNNRKVRMTIM